MFEERKTFNIHSFSLFLHLAKKGILPVGTKQREEDPSKTIFFYEDTKDVRDEAKEYTRLYKEYIKEKNNG